MNKYIKEMIKEAKFDGKSTGITSKMWIMKTGKVFSTGSNWHFRWAFGNQKMLEDNFGVSFDGISPKDEEQKVRIHLIRQGMFRLNHEVRGNRVTIEGSARYFNKRVKDSIIGLVMDNPDDFAYLNIILFDERVENVVKTKSAKFFNMDEREKVDKTFDLVMERKLKTEEDLIWESYMEEKNG